MMNGNNDPSRIQQLEAEMREASATLSKGSVGAGAEKRYGTAYQTLVRVGLRPQIRRKYRPS